MASLITTAFRRREPRIAPLPQHRLAVSQMEQEAANWTMRGGVRQEFDPTGTPHPPFRGAITNGDDQ